jgi:hypothetical protein
LATKEPKHHVQPIWARCIFITLTHQRSTDLAIGYLLGQDNK